MRPALLWKALDNRVVSCRLCNHFCRIEPGQRGLCGVRENHDGVLASLSADRVAALNLDPIEKKPLFHFLPGTKSLSVGTMGCNLECAFCQNYSLSQPPRRGAPVEGRPISPEELVAEALSLGAASISYTYSEPTVFFELVKPTAELAASHGLKNVLVSNGFMSAQCLDELAGCVHAANIDLKAFSEDFYRELCGARLAPVLENLKHIVRLGWWLEATTLVIPGKNDSPEELRELAAFIHDELGPDVPWHLSRFHPCYRLTDAPPTPVATLERAWNIGREAGLRFVYLGNCPGHDGENTRCPGCGELLINRQGYRIRRHDGAKPGHCGACGQALPGVGFDAGTQE